MANPAVTDTVVISGRMDPVHPGHIVTILRLLRAYKKIKVVLLKSPKRRWPVSYSAQLLNEIMSITGLTDRVEILINNTHFAKITKKEFDELGAKWYAGGNVLVNRHMEDIGVPVLYTDRAFEYSARNYPPPEG